MDQNRVNTAEQNYVIWRRYKEILIFGNVSMTLLQFATFQRQ